MSLLAQLNAILDALNIPVETGVFSGVPPDEYVVLTPLTDSFPLFGDNKPLIDVSDVRISLFTKGNYLLRASVLVERLFAADITVTERRYIGHENDTNYHNYCVDCASYKTLGG
jgi:hypothetical protein